MPFFSIFQYSFLLSEGSHSINATNGAVLCLMTSWDLSTVFTMNFHMTWISKKTLKPDLVKTQLSKQEKKLKKRRCLGMRIRKGNWCFCLWRRNGRRNKLFLLQYIHTPWCRVLLEKLTGLQLVKNFPAFLWNPKFHYRSHKHSPPVPVLGQSNPVHIPTSHLLEIHPNIIHPSTPRSPQCSLSLRCPHQDPIRPTFLTHTRHMPSPSHSSRFYRPHNIGWGGFVFNTYQY